MKVWRELGPVQRDAVSAGALAVLLCAATIGIYLLVNSRQPVPTPASWPLAAATLMATVAGCGLVGLRRLAPRTALCLATALILGCVALELRAYGPALALIVCAYTVTTLCPVRVAAPILGGLAVAHAGGGYILSRTGGDLSDLLTYWQVSGQDIHALTVATLASFGLPAAVGGFVRDRRRRTAELVARAEMLETEREQRDRAAAREERGRIARELHDIAAHDLSAIVVQAGAADRLLDADPDAARAVLADIRKQGRQSLAAMRQLVGVLRQDDPHEDTTGRRPTPGLRDLGDLLEVAHAAGMNVKTTITGTPAALPPLVDLTAFRLIQEALTNARRHAPAADVRVDVVFGQSLSIVVANDRPPPAHPRPTVAGHGLAGHGLGGYGLAGMRERVRQAGGRLRAGPAAGGGWRVSADLPLGVEES